MAKEHMTTKKLLKAQAKGVRLEMMDQGMSGFWATCFSIQQNTILKITEVMSKPYTKGSLHAREFPPIEVANRKQTTADTTAEAPK